MLSVDSRRLRFKHSIPKRSHKLPPWSLRSKLQSKRSSTRASASSSAAESSRVLMESTCKRRHRRRHEIGGWDGAPSSGFELAPAHGYGQAAPFSTVWTL